MNFKNKAVVVKAIQFDGTDESCDWLLEGLVSGNIGRSFNKLYFNIDGCTRVAEIGDYIILGKDGELYPCDKYVFERLYEMI